MSWQQGTCETELIEAPAKARNNRLASVKKNVQALQLFSTHPRPQPAPSRNLIYSDSIENGSRGIEVKETQRSVYFLCPPSKLALIAMGPGPTDAAPKSKKLKKSDAATVATKKTSKALKSAVEPIDSVPTNAKVPKASRKRAVDYLSDNDAAAVKDDTVKEKKSKKSKKARLGIEANGDAHVPKEVEEEAVDAKAKPKKTKKKVQALQAALEEPNEKLKKSKKVKKDDAADLEQGLTVKKVKSKKSKLNVEEEQDYDEDDDQTAALLAGFESSGDEEDPEDDTGLATENPKATITPTMRLELEEANKNEDQPGVVYVGYVFALTLF